MILNNDTDNCYNKMIDYFGCSKLWRTIIFLIFISNGKNNQIRL